MLVWSSSFETSDIVSALLMHDGITAAIYTYALSHFLDNFPLWNRSQNRLQ